MRKLIILLLPLVLTACGDGSAVDESIKAAYRDKLVTGCVATTQGSIPETVTVDIDKICACAADKVMEGKSAKELVSTVPGSAEDLAKVQACVKEIGPVKIDTKG